MEEYPRTLAELESRFSTPTGCRDYLLALRWPEGFFCPRCGSGTAWPIRELWLQCGECGYQTSVTSGTIFHGTRMPLALWFRAIWWVVAQKNGASALGLQQILGLGSYETAWTWLHKLRRAMVTPGRNRLQSHVEVDDSYLGGLEQGLRGRKRDKKALLITAAEIDGTRIGRIRMRRIPDMSTESICAFLEESVEPGTTVRTDGWAGYRRIEERGYRHEAVEGFDRHNRTIDRLPRVHRVFSLFKRWLMGTHQGAVSEQHLDYYADEFVFRFNRRTSRHRGKLFYRLLQNAVQMEPAPYKQIKKNIRDTKRANHNR